MRLRAAVFTLLCPGVVAVLVPSLILAGAPVAAGWWRLGWAPLLAGGGIYLLCLLNFLAAGGTPAIFFNPMYLGVVLAIVVFVEEPHLRDKQGAAYDEYCRQVPRWTGL